MTVKPSIWAYFVLPNSSLRESEKQFAIDALHPEPSTSDQPG